MARFLVLLLSAAACSASHTHPPDWLVGEHLIIAEEGACPYGRVGRMVAGADGEVRLFRRNGDHLDFEMRGDLRADDDGYHARLSVWLEGGEARSWYPPDVTLRVRLTDHRWGGEAVIEILGDAFLETRWAVPDVDEASLASVRLPRSGTYCESSQTWRDFELDPSGAERFVREGSRREAWPASVEDTWSEELEAVRIVFTLEDRGEGSWFYMSTGRVPRAAGPVTRFDPPTARVTLLPQYARCFDLDGEVHLDLDPASDDVTIEADFPLHDWSGDGALIGYRETRSTASRAACPYWLADGEL